MYWVHPTNQQWYEYWDFDTLYKDVRNHPDRFYTYCWMNTEQFDYILSQIEYLIYELRTNFWAAVCPEEKLAICVRYPNKALHLKIDNIVMVLSSFTVASCLHSSMAFWRKDSSFKMIKMKNRWQQPVQKQCLKLKKKHTFWLASQPKKQCLNLISYCFTI